MAFTEQGKIKPKVKTTAPAPVVEQATYDWEDPYDFSQFVPEPAPGKPVEKDYYTLPFQFGDSLALQGLSLGNMQERLNLQNDYKKAMSAWGQQNQLYGIDQKINAAATSGTGKGWKPGAYGFQEGKAGTSGTQGSGAWGLQPQVSDAFKRAFAAMNAAGLGTPRVNSGWRSIAEETALLKQGLTGMPGRSPHGYGLALDIGLSDKQYNWLRQNGAKFGLFQPLSSERWHWQLLPNLF